MKYHLNLLLFFILSQAAVAQETGKNKYISPEAQTIAYMKDQIKQLKNGALLVRLQTRSNTIDAMKKNGQNELAEEVSRKQSVYNKEIIAAFKNNFTFCPVYFFFSNHSDQILNEKINEVVFLNDSLQPDPGIKLNNMKFLTAEFGPIEPDTAKYFSNYTTYPGEKGQEKRSEYYGGADTGLNGLKIMNNKFIQLKDPFPYYARTSGSPPSKKNLFKAVSKMNNKLLSYYKSVIGG
jgi:hypothetical protein